MASSALFDVFAAYADFGAGAAKGSASSLDSAKFAKLCRETGEYAVIDKKVTTTTVDLAFTKVKAKGERKITFDQFLAALTELAATKYPGDPDGPAKLQQLVASSGGPKAEGTVAETGGIYSKLTDHSQYTGAHKERFDADGHGRGLAGRDSVATGKGTVGAHHGGAVHDLSAITRSEQRGGTTLSSATAAKRSSVSSTGSAEAPAAGTSARRSSGTAVPTGAPNPAAPARSSRTSAEGSSGATAAAAAAARASEGKYDLYDIFISYCQFGGTSAVADEMDNAKFAKLCRESGVINKTLPAASVDITFNKVKEKSKRTITYAQFQQALAILAAERFPGSEPTTAQQQILDLILAAGGPAVAGATRADASGIYSKLTDHSQYTGAHKERFDAEGHGKGIAGRESVSVGHGPAKYHGGKVEDLSQILRQ